MATLHFIVRKTKTKELLLFSGEVSKEVFDELSKNLESILTSSVTKEKISYSPSKMPENMLETISFSRIKNYTLFSRLLENVSNPSICEIMDSSDSLKTGYEMWGYCYLLEKEGEKYLFFRKYKNQGLLKTNSLRMIFDKGHFTSIKQSIFILDYDIDCFMKDNILYILKKIILRCFLILMRRL